MYEMEQHTRKNENARVMIPDQFYLPARGNSKRQGVEDPMGSEKGEKKVLVYSFKERAWLDGKKRIETRERDEFESSFVLFLCTTKES